MINTYSQEWKRMLGDRIRVSCNKKRYDVHKLSYLTGITTNCLLGYLGGMTVPKVSNLIKIAEKLEVSIDWLLGHEVNKGGKRCA